MEPKAKGRLTSTCAFRPTGCVDRAAVGHCVVYIRPAKEGNWIPCKRRETRKLIKETCSYRKTIHREGAILGSVKVITDAHERAPSRAL